MKPVRTLALVGLLSSLLGATALADTPKLAKASKPATAAEVAAACKTTATYDKKAPSTLTFKVKNTAKREVRVCWLDFYLYDKAGAQLGHVTLPYNYKIKPGETMGQPYEFDDLGKQVGDKAVASIEAVIGRATFTDGAAFEDKTLVPDTRPRAATK